MSGWRFTYEQIVAASSQSVQLDDGWMEHLQATGGGERLVAGGWCSDDLVFSFY